MTNTDDTAMDGYTEAEGTRTSQHIRHGRRIQVHLAAGGFTMNTDDVEAFESFLDEMIRQALLVQLRSILKEEEDNILFGSHYKRTGILR